MNNILILELIGIPTIFFGGVFFHFLWKYFGKKDWMAIISPVNESIWEHLKLSFYPVLLFTLLESIIIKDLPNNFLFSELFGIYTMILFILIVEAIYPKILKRNILIIDLTIFLVAIAISQLISFHIMTKLPAWNINNWILIIVIIFQTYIFGRFSFKSPKLEIFRDPLKKSKAKT